MLADGARQVREANKTLAAVGQLDLLGHDALRGGAHAFEEKWRWGLDKLDEAAEAVIDRLRETKRNYEALEEEYSGLFGKFLAAQPAEPEPARGIGAVLGEAAADERADAVRGDHRRGARRVGRRRDPAEAGWAARARRSECRFYDL